MHPEPDDSADLLEFERLAWADGHRRVAGVDEVGRGPLAGPVVAAAVVLPSDGLGGVPVADSKTLTHEQRTALARALRRLPGVGIGIGSVDPRTIDRVNILRATHMAMRAAVAALADSPDFALVDGLRVDAFPVPARFIVRGDGRSASIAAASIVAKVSRDLVMEQLEKTYPGYGFCRHKGYGTPEHLAALAELGPCPAHRLSFAPVRRLVNPPPVQLELPLG